MTLLGDAYRLGQGVAADPADALHWYEMAAAKGDVYGTDPEDIDEDVSDPAGDIGLVAVRGPNLFSGYWPDGAGGPDADGWFRTADVGFLDPDGDLHLVDRSSDLVIVNGFNVYPREVEQVLAELPAVAEAAVVGVPDENSGEAVKAVLVRAEGAQLTEEQVLAHCTGAAGPVQGACGRRVRRCPAPHTYRKSRPAAVGGAVVTARAPGHRLHPCRLRPVRQSGGRGRADLRRPRGGLDGGRHRHRPRAARRVRRPGARDRGRRPRARLLAGRGGAPPRRARPGSALTSSDLLRDAQAAPSPRWTDGPIQQRYRPVRIT